MSESRRILVTGAGGFIGGRMVEVMHHLGAGAVRGGMRRWATGARIGRLPVEMVRCDIRDQAQVKDALDGVTHVVHCAVGEHSSTVEGTRILLRGAREAGIERFVHLSTIDVYGVPSGSVDETHDLRVTGRAYGDSKIEAEKACREAADGGLPVTILRPTLVHGPFSATWTIAYAHRLLRRPWQIVEADAQGTCNLVYVDDLVAAVLAAFEADTAPGEAFNINGPERPTWHEYFTALNEALGLPLLVAANPMGARVKAAAVLPFRKAAKFGMRYFPQRIVGLSQRSRLARSAMLKAEGLIRATPVPGEFAVYGRPVSFETEKARQGLSFQPRFPMADALKLTAQWLRHHGYVDQGAA